MDFVFVDPWARILSKTPHGDTPPPPFLWVSLVGAFLSRCLAILCSKIWFQLSSMLDPFLFPILVHSVIFDVFFAS